MLNLTRRSHLACGAAMSAVGGALVAGALPQIKRSQRARDALVMGVGLGILANS